MEMKNPNKRKEKRVMRKMKKLLSILVAATMTLAMAAPSFADDGASIKVTNATQDITYQAYKIFEGTVATDDPNQLAYKATADQAAWFRGQTGNPFDFSSDNGTGYYVTIAEGYNQDSVIDFLDGLVTRENGTNAVVTTGFVDPNPIPGEEGASETEILFNNLDYGYYMVVSSMNAAVSLTPTTPNATVIDKNQNGPSDNPDDGDGKFVKRSDQNAWDDFTTANYEGTLNFKVQYSTTNYDHADRITAYQITDTLGSGLSYVMTGEGENAVADVKAYVSATNGGDQTEITGTTVTMSQDKKSFTINVPWAETNPSPGKIIIEYSATVDNDGNVNDNSNGDTGRTNTANLTYDTETGDHKEPSSMTETTTTKTYALAISKTDGAGQPLAGAKFTLMDENNNAVSVSEVAGETGVYSYDPDGTAVLTSPSTGVITIKGVQAGTYNVTETVAPDGYNPLVGSKEIEAKVDVVYTTTKTVYYDTEGNESVEETTITANPESSVPASMITVINKTGTTLPSTGGIGTTIFYAAGIILMAGAVFFVVRRKRA